MKTSFVNLMATDSVKLQGLLFEPDVASASAVIHLHGMAGSFYENSFITTMAKEYTQHGLAFLSFNNRGHDYLCDLTRITEQGEESFMGGAAYEVFKDCVYDIEGAIKFMHDCGYEKIILQGHSSGANKLVYAMSKKHLDVCGVILISPCDDIGLHLDDVEDRYGDLISFAEEKVKNNNPDSMMPENTFFSYLLSAKTYLECFGKDSPLDTFPYRDSENKFAMFAMIDKPIFVSFGTDGDFLMQDTDFVFSLLQKKKSAFAKLSCHRIEGASHSYSGKEDVLVNAIMTWVTDVVLA